MNAEVDLTLPERIEFQVDHDPRRIVSNDPEIFMMDEGTTSEPYLRYFTLHWHGREIPIRTREQTTSVGHNADNQPITDKHLDSGPDGGPLSFETLRKILRIKVKGRICLRS